MTWLAEFTWCNMRVVTRVQSTSADDHSHSLTGNSSQFNSCRFFSSCLKQFDIALTPGAITIHLSEPHWGEGFILTCQLRFSNKMYFYCATIIPQQNISWAVQPRRINCLNAARQQPHVLLLKHVHAMQNLKCTFETPRGMTAILWFVRGGDDYFLFFFFSSSDGLRDTNSTQPTHQREGILRLPP